MTKATIRLAKVGGAYVGAGVLALESFNALTVPLELASWIYWLVVIAVVSGLPLVLLLAVVLLLTVRHIRADPEIEADSWMSWAPRALGAATLLFVFGGGGAMTPWVILADDGVRAREEAFHSPSVAVMPFGFGAWLGMEGSSPVPRARITPLGSCRASRDGSSC